ncbi:Mannose-6-phosphate isomerase [Actinomyces bovis]|uniref:mannose-6-phosphate isomerase n=1 Tax=Actinomyces bovis TaxID=1658 RepID=A0ABY1VNB6_9ACTO|nr:mannose-6-phosphate isomerase, class I [Actinomyces bovis]SPT53318.1 Mannose-6-phosphate isomerase [Actinomyces bovis]VEG52662.1 Mannose-6-phosphate isomerase [Actinomyces israelii]
MERLVAARQSYDWGSRSSLPELLRVEPDGQPWAELWFGTHPAGPTQLADGRTLSALIESGPERFLGADVVQRFGPHLPFLLKLIAPDRSLSLQVHPSLEQAAAGYAAEDSAGVPLDSPQRCFRDTNHKPEMVLALTEFEAVAGFRAPRRAAEVLAGLEAPVARRMRRTLRLNPTRYGIRSAFTELVSAETRPSAAELKELVQEMGWRLEQGTATSAHAYRTAVAMARDFPGDPGVAAALLLNPVTLRPGEALFIPAGSVHAYISGLGAEVMASSDNVLRAGLTSKHVDVPTMLSCVDYVAAPPVRPAPEYLSRATRAYYAPVDDFELLVTQLLAEDGVLPVPGGGARLLLVVEGSMTVATSAGSLRLERGQGAFAGADEKGLRVEGAGTLLQVDVP